MCYFQKKKIAFVGFLLMFMALLQPAYAQSYTYALGIDTVAGQETTLKAKNFPADSSVVFHVTTADGKKIKVTKQSNAAGDAVVKLSSLHTRVSGIYSLYADLVNGDFKTPTTKFHVYEGQLDTQGSKIFIDRSVIKADGVDFARVKVQLQDDFGNSLANRAMKLLSSNEHVMISPNISVSDKSGLAEFKVQGSVSGTSTLMAIDTTDDQLLNMRTKITFIASNDYMADAGGDLVQKAYAAEFGVLDGFEIEGIPASVDKNDNISFTVKAVDGDGLVVEDYTGTVRFSVEGSNSSAVTLPENYKFSASDLGRHTFSLGLSFAENGTYKIVVSDLNDKFKMGEMDVVVGNTLGNVTSSGTGEKPMINAPAAGTYSQAEQTISGTAKTSSTVQVFDNNQSIGSVPVGPTGKFSYQTDALADGKHSIYVVNVDPISLEVIGTSDPVEIIIDTTPPALEEIRLDPSKNIKPGDVINVKVYSEQNLAQAALIFNYDIIELNASLDDTSVFVGTIQAPREPGVYKLSVLLVDELQNEITYEDQATITVDNAGGNIDTVTGDDTNVTDNQEETDGQIAPVAGAPSVVTGVIAYGSDKRVTLVWDAAMDDVMVKNYKVYYGPALQNMQTFLETKDASTTWYVPDLQNGKEYFFAISAIDDQGNESASKSEIVSGIPFVLEIKNALSEGPTQPLFDPNLRQAAYSGPFPDQTTGTGPGVLILFGGSVLAGLLLRMKK